MLDFAIRIAKDAGRLLRDRVGTHLDISLKSEINLVTDVDRASEQLIRDGIASHYPHHQMLGEESGLDEIDSDYRWVVDPLDGTTNYAHGFPHFAVSIALQHKGITMLGVVNDPMRNELFVAERGAGATLNRRTIHVSKTAELSRSILSTGFPYDIRTAESNNLNHWKNFAMNAQALRRVGAASLDLCYVACGRFDGFWELSLSPWDTAAGALIVAEAGGRVTNFSGQPFSDYQPQVLASNGLIHDRMIEVLAMTT